jgi:hypothetical protein
MEPELAADFERSKYSHPRIAYRVGTETFFGVEIGSTTATKSAAGICAKRPGRKRKQNLFGYQRRQINLFCRVVTQTQIVTVQLLRPTLCLAQVGNQDDIEFLRQIKGIILQTTAATTLKYTGEFAVKKQFLT